MPAMFYIPMPLPGTLGSPMFEGANVTEFLERYEDLCSDYHVTARDRLARLPRYCIRPIAETIKSLKEWQAQNYAALKKALLAEYKNDDTRQLLYSVHFLENYRSIPRTEKDDILDYCRKFDRIAQHCIEKKVLLEYTTGIWFIHGLPPSTAGKLIRKFAIDTEDPSTIDYPKMRDYIMRQALSNRAIQRMNATRTPLQQAEVVDLIERLQPVVSITREQQFADPIAQAPAKTIGLDVVVDQLTRAFEKLSVNLIGQPQGQQQRLQRPQVQARQPQGFAGLPEGGNFQSVSMRAYSMQRTGSRRPEGICWYCFN
jgi:hypothetical protein